MSNQIRGTTTNMTKLVSWDIDLYQSMDTEENCLIWLSQQEKYLLGNVLQQMKWSTRWTSEQGTPQPDRDLIAENLAYKLSQEYCVDICQLIIDCIDDPNSGVADSINNIIRPNTQNDSRDYGQSQSGTLLGDGNNTLCNLDVWYGGILNLVEQLNTNNEDALQVFEVVTNVNELFANVVGSITGIDESSIDAVLQWITFIQQSIMENYVAQWTTFYRDAVVCDLFCMVKDTCELTPTMLYDYFLGRLNGQLQYESLLDQTLNFLFTGLWTGTEIVDVMMLSQIGFRAQLEKWFDFIGFNSIDVDLRLGFSNPSNNWQLLCNCGWVYDSDWLNSDDSWLSFIGASPYDWTRAIWSIGNGWIGQDGEQFAGFFIRTDDIHYAMPLTAIDSVTLTYDIVKGVTNSSALTSIAIIATLQSGGTAVKTQSFANTLNGAGQTMAFVINDDVVDLRVLVRSSTASTLGALTGSGQTVSVQVSGTGTNPFP